MLSAPAATLIAALVAVASACYSPAYPDCQYTCASAADCPGGLECGGDGMCRVAGASCATDDGGVGDGDDAAADQCDDGIAVRGELCLALADDLVSSGFELRDCQMVNVNGDPYLDIVCIRTDSIVSTLLGNGTPTFDAPRDVTSMYSTSHLISGQVNGAGTDELYTLSGPAAEAFVWSAAVNNLMSTGTINDAPAAPNNVPKDLALVRWVDDPTVPLRIAMLWSNTLKVARVTADNMWPTVTAEFQAVPGPSQSLAVVPGIVAGHDAIIVATGTQLLRYETGPDNMPLAVVPSLALGGTAHGIAAGDVDGDDRADLVATILDAGMQDLWLLRGDSSDFGATDVKTELGEVVGLLPEVVIADLDGDPYRDIIYASSTGAVHTLYVQRGAADLSMLPAVIPFDLGARADDIHVGDANSDGVPDILVSSTTQEGGARLLWIRSHP